MRRPEEPGERAARTLLASAYRYAASLAANVPDAEDLVHESWVRVRSRYGEDASRAVLFRAIRNLYVDRWRHETRFPSRPLDDSEAFAPDAGENDPSRGCDGGLGAHLARLRDVEREALFLSVIEGYTAAEIAELTDSTRGNVLSLIHRAKRKLQRWIDEAEGGGGAPPAAATDASGAGTAEADGADAHDAATRRPGGAPREGTPAAGPRLVVSRGRKGG